ncbi:Cytochrome c oxidase subunit [Apis cerana cerana]|uniref:Cytochrome c oxidase subunit n=1 Tax=Apis cerana cerana TaxID=94128 RepID=A0A2A3EJ33_APICC|nr:Cytochrome c oxidase subunit [Apis cerana cerana]
MSFHQFNAFTGRLKQSTQLQALYPLSPKPLEKIETPKMMFDSIKTKIASTSSSLSRHQSTIPPKMKKLQQEWQVDLSKPSFLLRGTSDLIIYRVTVATTLLGFVMIYKINHLDQ